jgi:hypothetical protein
MLASATTRLDKDETFGPLNIVVAQSTTLSMFNGEVVRGAVDELECGKDLGELRFDGLIQW